MKNLDNGSLKFSSLIKSLYKWDSCGLKMIDGGINKGTTLICRTPHIAEKAWFHEIYAPPLSDKEINHIKVSLDLDLPEDYIKLLKEFNGINIFSNSLSIWGLRQSYKRSGDEVFQPFDVLSLNRNLRGGMSKQWFIIGSYFDDGSYVAYELSEDRTTVYRCDKNSWEILNKWQNIYKLLSDEINRLSKLFDEKGVMLDENVPTIPQSSPELNKIPLYDNELAPILPYSSSLKSCEMKALKKYYNIRKKIDFDEVSLGNMRIYLFKEEAIEKAQLGYRFDDKGNSLVGTSEGDWRGNWLVIAYEDLCDDPIFIDIMEKNFSVYTAIHGKGKWEPIRIASSFTTFIKALKYILKLSRGRENPVKLKNNPILEKDKSVFIKQISATNDFIELTFWENWLKNL